MLVRVLYILYITSAVSLAQEFVCEHANADEVHQFRQDEERVVIFNDKVKQNQSLQEKEGVRVNMGSKQRPCNM